MFLSRKHVLRYFVLGMCIILGGSSRQSRVTRVRILNMNYYHNDFLSRIAFFTLRYVHINIQTLLAHGFTGAGR